MTTDDFEASVRTWVVAAKHPTTSKASTSMVYQPMLELLAYLRANGFKTYIVSGGGAAGLIAGFSQERAPGIELKRVMPYIS